MLCVCVFPPFSLPQGIEENACSYTEADLVTGKSCKGIDSCRSAQIGTIKSNSCIGETACSRVKLCLVEDGCIGFEACYDKSMGIFDGKSMYSVIDSCKDDEDGSDCELNPSCTKADDENDESNNNNNNNGKSSSSRTSFFFFTIISTIMAVIHMALC